MKKHPIVGLLSLVLAGAIAAPAVMAQVASISAQPPAAKRVPHETAIHGRTLKDDYFWLREKSNPDVIGRWGWWATGAAPSRLDSEALTDTTRYFRPRGNSFPLFVYAGGT